MKATIQESTKSFLRSLKSSSFQGDIEDSYGARIVASTDNSVYQIIPEAIIYPKVRDDINFLVKHLADYIKDHPASDISLVARGGGTGTNGQSLNDSLILDTSRYLNHIIEFDQKTKLVTVEPGVVLDQLNNYLAPYGLFFPPDVSTSSRATIGGMVATDASGKGSRVYGKTSNYIHSLDVVLSDGSDFKVKEKPQLEVDQKNTNILAGEIEEKVFKVVIENKAKIKEVFPKMNRGLTGYNLEHVLTDNKRFQMAYLLAGSEGTLALSKKITLEVIPKPKLRALVAVLYDNFDHTLEHISLLLKAKPIAIEVLDDKILEVAQKDTLWQDVEESFSNVSLTNSIKGLNFIEITADSKIEIESQYKALSSIIDKSVSKYGVISYLIETDSKVISSLWSIRKRAVGLLASLEGKRRPLAFVEDCAVPPESLPEFIKDFRAILDKHELDYGMYGHADVGCLHVRPALNMTEETDQKLLRTISDEVALLSKRYGGLLWGEHGRGFRGEYSPLFFGEALYPLLGEIKSAFDPNNLFNPGKLATPTSNSFNSSSSNSLSHSSKIVAIDAIPFRGQFDTQISQQKFNDYKTAILCNGNAACFSWDVSEAMCPSYKATRDKRLSPKGRAAMLREWMRLSSDKTVDKSTMRALESEIVESLSSCLSCKSCTHSCPIKVDIPELKSRFLESHHQKNPRKFSDRLFCSFELISRVGRKMPSMANALIQSHLAKTLLRYFFGIMHTPRFSSSLEIGLQKRQAQFISTKQIFPQKENSVILLPDSFNASYDSSVILACYDVLTTLGFEVLVAPVLENGKALYVKGYRKKLKRVAKQHTDQMELLAKAEIPLISAEVVTRLMHSKEYPEIVGKQIDYSVWSIEKWLNEALENDPKLFEKFCKSSLNNKKKEQGKETQKEKQSQPYKLLPHCMEQTSDKNSATHWQLVFKALGLILESENAGCCGMSGLFGHEKDNQQLAESIYQQNWQEKVKTDHNVLATGFSCRCQLENHAVSVRHPIEVVATVLGK